MAKPKSTPPSKKSNLATALSRKPTAPEKNTSRPPKNSKLPGYPTPMSPASDMTPIEGQPVLNNLSAITAERVYIFKAGRFNPIRNLTPEVLSNQLDQFKAGYLRSFALTQEAIFDRDDDIVNCSGKRIDAIKRRAWEITIDDDATETEGKAQKAALEYFFRNLEVTSAVDLNQKSGFSLLVEQMMLSIGFKYSAHEIIWKPSPKGLTATMNFIPLYFFENRTGKLRFLPSDFAIEGDDLDEHWMITVGRGIMEACAVCYMFKHLPLKDWLIYCERHGMPGIHGKSTAAVGTPQWNALVEAVGQISMNFACVTSKDDEIDKLDFTAQGELPYIKLVDLMKRAIASIWRGADLSTMSSGHGSEGHGASLQGEEAHTIEEGDTMFLNETLNMQLCKRVLQWSFGDDVTPCVKVKIVVPPRVDVEREIAALEFLTSNGGQVKVSYFAERFGIPVDNGDDNLTPPVQQAGEIESATKPNKAGLMANEARSIQTREVIKKAKVDFARATADAFLPVTDRLQAILELPNEALVPALRKFVADVPAFLQEINRDPKNAKVLASALSSGVFNGIVQAVVRRA